MPALRNLAIDDYDAIIQVLKLAGLQSVRPKGRDSRDVFAEQLDALRSTAREAEFVYS